MMILEEILVLLENGNVEQAKNLLLSKVADDPNSIQEWKLLCGIASRKNDWELGKSCFKRLSELDPSSSIASSGLVQCYLNLDEFDKVEDEIRRFEAEADLDNEDSRIVLDEHRLTLQKIK